MGSGEKNYIKLEGSVDSVRYSNPENGYTVLDLDSGGDYVTVVGELGNVDAGEELILTGEYVTHPKFGVQFKAQMCERKLPATASAILKYLSSGIVKGVGKATAKRLVEAFGDKTLEVIEKEPHRLTEVKGITKDKAEGISLEFQRIFGIRSLMIYLTQFALPPAVAVSCWKRWGQYAVEIIGENPYRLCEDGIDVLFSKAEAIAAELGISKESPSRINAGVIYVLIHNSMKGHTCLPEDKLMGAALSLLKVEQKLIEDSLQMLITEDELCEYYKGERRFIFLKDYYVAESYIAGRLKVMSDCLKDTGTDYYKLIEIEEKAKGIEYAELQKKAIALALSQGFIILTGGPGTGKTTTLKAMISLYEQRGMDVVIAAPTGRAAKRISDLTGYDAKTIHRLLEVSYEAGGKLKFVHNETNPIKCDVMIVDEMSMVDVLLFESLLRAMKLSCRLIMVGDCDQLPSVGAGNLLRDMIDSGCLTVVSLTEIFRQAQQSCIITNAHAIVTGNPPDLSRTDSDFFFMQRLDVNEAVSTVVELCRDRLPKAYGYSPTEDIQVLCPSRKGMLGSEELNKALQAALNPPSERLSEVKGLQFTFRDNDKVMQIRNNYDIIWSKENESGTGVFNGDIGTIVKVKRTEGTVLIDFEGRFAEYSFDMLDQIELAYAVTVHKSQGSEFNAVILPLLGGFDKLLYRNLLYTAVTRAKQRIIIVGSKNVVMTMVNNNRRTLRYSCLKKMITEEIKGNGVTVQQED